MGTSFLTGVNIFFPTGGLDLSSYGTLFEAIDPSLGITLNGSDVSDAADQSVEGNDIAQATAADQPLFNSSSSNFNNKPTFTFDGTSEFLGRTTFTGGAESQPTLWAMAYKNSTTIGVLTLFDGPTSRNMVRVVGAMQMYAGSSVEQIWNVDTSVHIGMWLFDGASSDSWRDGTNTTPGASPGTDGMNGINLGANTGGIEWFNGEIGYLAGFTGNPSTTNKNGIGNDMADYFGTTWTDIV